MYKLNKISLFIIIMVLVLIIAVLITFIEVNDVLLLRHDREHNLAMIGDLRQIVEDKDFAYTAASMECDNLEQVIESKDELILELQIAEEMNILYKEILQYCVVYIQYLQVDMAGHGLDYPDFIVDSILTDRFFEEIKEQEEIFKKE